MDPLRLPAYGGMWPRNVAAAPDNLHRGPIRGWQDALVDNAGYFWKEFQLLCDVGLGVCQPESLVGLETRVYIMAVVLRICLIKSWALPSLSHSQSNESLFVPCDSLGFKLLMYQRPQISESAGTTDRHPNLAEHVL